MKAKETVADHKPSCTQNHRNSSGPSLGQATANLSTELAIVSERRRPCGMFEAERVRRTRTQIAARTKLAGLLRSLGMTKAAFIAAPGDVLMDLMPHLVDTSTETIVPLMVDITEVGPPKSITFQGKCGTIFRATPVAVDRGDRVLATYEFTK